MGQGGITDALGYNTEQVEAIGDGINKYASQTGELIVTSIKNNIVDKVAEDWVSEAAVEYFENFKQKLKGHEERITDVFRAFSKSVGQGGENWSTTTKGTAPTMPEVENVTLDLDISSIRATDGNGDRYMYENIEENVNSYVENSRTEILSGFSNMESEINGDAAFFGAGQSEALQEAARSLGDEVNNILDEIISGDDESLISRIQYFKTQYSETATQNTTLFENSAFTEE